MPPTFPSSLIPTVTCVVVNWNGWQDTIACLASLAAQNYPSLRVLLVDNGSTNDSVVRIRESFPDLAILETRQNLGFSSGSNAGMRQALAEGADYVWLLNNDTIAPPDTCSKLVAKALQEPGARLIGSVLYYMHNPTQIQAWGGGNIIVWMGHTTHFYRPSKIGPNGYLTFASVLIPREVLLKVGVLFEGSFMYWDDSDFALRVTKAGYTLAVAEDTAILHKEGGSAERRSPIIDRYATISGLHFLKRHARIPLFSMAIFLTLKLAKRALRGEIKNAKAVFLAIGDYWRKRKNIYSDQI